MYRLFLAAALVVGVIAISGCGNDTDSKQPPAASDAKAVLCPTEVPAREPFDASALLGLTLVRARAQAAKYRCEVRPVSVDGRKLANVQDVRDDRVNVALEKARISKVLGVC